MAVRDINSIILGNVYPFTFAVHKATNLCVWEKSSISYTATALRTNLQYANNACLPEDRFDQTAPRRR